jgi:2-keto-4-pentenoate hydratase
MCVVATCLGNTPDAEPLVQRLAARLSEARRTHGRVASLSDAVPDLTVDDAYAIAELLHREAVSAGAVAVGYKLGFTDQTAWMNLGLTAPFWSRVYDTTVTFDAEVDLGPLVEPRLEPEVVVGIGADLEPGATLEEVSAGVGWAALGVELIQCHYQDWRVTPVDAVADAGLHGRLVVGEPVEVREAQLPELVQAHLVVERSGVRVAEGDASTALGGPVQALMWLLRLPGIDGLSAGSVITTGSVTRAVPVAPGGQWAVEATGSVPFGQLEVRCSLAS